MNNVKIKIVENNSYNENLSNIRKLEIHFLKRIERQMELFQSDHITINEFDKVYNECMEQLNLIRNIVL